MLTHQIPFLSHIVATLHHLSDVVSVELYYATQSSAIESRVNSAKIMAPMLFQKRQASSIVDPIATEFHLIRKKNH